jgi:hypothetical protein
VIFSDSSLLFTFFLTLSSVPAQASAFQAAKRPKQARVKNDPKLIAAARELRDRWLEKVNENPSLLLPSGKYDVSRALVEPAHAMQIGPALPLSLPAAQGNRMWAATTPSFPRPVLRERAG